MRITILGKRWNLRFVPWRRGRSTYGYCEHPAEPGKEIVITDGHSDQLMLDTLLHEFLHAGAWNLSEETVDQWSTDVSRILIKLGWTRKAD